MIERELGRGGMGAVLLVRRASSGQLLAMKRVHLAKDPGRRLAFLSELWTWIDLPRHPHLVQCRFFRTVDSQLSIFAEFVDGDSLAGLIRAKRLVDPAACLDVAIQTAWGLAALHALGLLHQDVKPANVLVDAHGFAKVADFGLTAARTRLTADRSGIGAARNAAQPAHSAITARHGTRAYQSPEQAEGLKVDVATDIWSYGLLLLEVFTRDLEGRPGVAAPWALKKVTMNQGTGIGMPSPLPHGVAEILRRCFERQPRARWRSMDDVAEALIRIYQDVAGSEYPREKPPTPMRPERTHATPDRWTNWGYQWDDPRDYLEEALAETPHGGDVREIERRLAATGAVSRTSQALVDIALYEETLVRLRALVHGGRGDLTWRLYRVCAEKASVHAYLGDAPGALALFEEAIDAVHTIVPRSVDTEEEVAKTYINRGLTCFDAGDPRAAVREHATASRKLAALVARESRASWCQSLAKTYVNLGNALDELELYAGAVEAYGYANDLREWLVRERRQDEDETLEVVRTLAESYHNMSGTLLQGGRPGEAKELSGMAMSLLTRLEDPRTDVRIARTTGFLWLTHAQARSALGEHSEAVKACERAILLFDELQRVQDRPEARALFAQAIGARAQIAEAANDIAGAIEWWRRAISMLGWLIQEGGQYHLEDRLALAIDSYERLNGPS